MDNLILGIEIGGTKLQVVLGTDSGEILASEKAQVDIHLGGKGIRNRIERLAPVMIRQAQRLGGKVIGVGCGFGGPIDKQKGLVLKSIQIKGWENFRIKSWLESVFSLPAVVENDSNAAAWGEYRLGVGQGTRHFFYTNIGSGIGGGIIINSALYQGSGFGAGEFGHLYIPDWISNSVGKAEEIEKICSGWSIENRLKTSGYVPKSSILYDMVSGQVSQLSTYLLGEAAKRGDSFAQEEIDRVAHSLGIGLANVINLLDIERIAIGGGVSNLGKILIEPIRKYTQQYVFIANQGNYDIFQCQLGENAVPLGSILLACDELDLLLDVKG